MNRDSFFEASTIVASFKRCCQEILISLCTIILGKLTYKKTTFKLNHLEQSKPFTRWLCPQHLRIPTYVRTNQHQNINFSVNGNVQKVKTSFSKLPTYFQLADQRHHSYHLCNRHLSFNLPAYPTRLALQKLRGYLAPASTFRNTSKMLPEKVC